MPHHRYTLDELSGITGFTRRTIRSYIQQGLIDPPDSLGRNARYHRKHLVGLQAIRALRENHAMRIGEIRSVLLFAEREIVEEFAAEVGLPDPEERETSARHTGSALEYLQSLKESSARYSAPSRRSASLPGAGVSGGAPHSQGARSGATGNSGGSPVERLLRNMERLSEGRPVPRRSRGEQWVRIPVTHDIEIAVRGVTAPGQVARLEAVADRLRMLLMEEDEYDDSE